MCDEDGDDEDDNGMSQKQADFRHPIAGAPLVEPLPHLVAVKAGLANNGDDEEDYDDDDGNDNDDDDDDAQQQQQLKLASRNVHPHDVNTMSPTDLDPRDGIAALKVSGAANEHHTNDDPPDVRSSAKADRVSVHALLS